MGKKKERLGGGGLGDWHKKNRKKENLKNKQRRQEERNATLLETKSVQEVRQELRKLEQVHKLSKKELWPHGVQNKWDRLSKEIKLLEAEDERKRRERIRNANNDSNNNNVSEWQQRQRKDAQDAESNFQKHKLEVPQLSVYYDAILNPFGVPPPGKPRMYHAAGGGTTLDRRFAVLPKQHGGTGELSPEQLQLMHQQQHGYRHPQQQQQQQRNHRHDNYGDPGHYGPAPPSQQQQLQGSHPPPPPPPQQQGTHPPPPPPPSQQQQQQGSHPSPPLPPPPPPPQQQQHQQGSHPPPPPPPPPPQPGGPRADWPHQRQQQQLRHSNRRHEESNQRQYCNDGNIKRPAECKGSTEESKNNETGEIIINSKDEAGGNSTNDNNQRVKKLNNDPPSLPPPSAAVARLQATTKSKGKKRGLAYDLWASTEELEYEARTTGSDSLEGVANADHDQQEQGNGSSKKKTKTKRKRTTPQQKQLMIAKRWLYQDNSTGQMQGPYPVQQMVQWIGAGWFPPHTLVKPADVTAEGATAEWQPAVAQAAFSHLFPEQPEQQQQDPIESPNAENLRDHSGLEETNRNDNSPNNATVQDRIAALRQQRTQLDSPMSERFSDEDETALKNQQSHNQQQKPVPENPDANSTAQDRIAALKLKHQNQQENHQDKGDNKVLSQQQQTEAADAQEPTISVQDRIATLKQRHQQSSREEQASPTFADSGEPLPPPPCPPPPPPPLAQQTVQDRIAALKGQGQQSKEELESQSRAALDSGLPLPPPPPPAPLMAATSDQGDINIGVAYPVDDNIHTDVPPSYPVHDGEEEDYPYNNAGSSAYPVLDDDEDASYPVTDAYPVDEDEGGDYPVTGAYPVTDETHELGDVSGREPEKATAVKKKLQNVDKDVIAFLPTNLRKKRN